MFPFSLDQIAGADSIEISRLAEALNESLKANSEIRTRNQKATGLVHLQTFFVGKSKGIIDEVDKNIAKVARLSDVEADFIINYDIKYRMGADEDDAE